MFVKFKDLEGIFKDLIPYQKRIKSLYRKIVELGYTGTEEEFVNFIYTEVTASLGKQDIKDKFKEIENSIENNIKVIEENIESNVERIETKIKDDNFYLDPPILVDEKNTKYVNITDLTGGCPYKLSNKSPVSTIQKVVLRAVNDDGTFFDISDKDNTLGFSKAFDSTVSVHIIFKDKDTKDIIQILFRYTSIINAYTISIRKNQDTGKWESQLIQPIYLTLANKYKYTPTDDYNPATKKYVDDEISERTSKEVLDIKNADWNQNDETQSDYIKNRPFYEGLKESVLISEQSIVFDEDGDCSDLDYNYDFRKANVPFKVIFDDIEYRGISEDGNFGSIIFSFTTNDGVEVKVQEGWVYTDSLIGTHTIKLSVFVEGVYKLDDKYLSDNVAMKDYIENIIPTKVSQLVNDSQYVTLDDLDNKKLATEEFVNEKLSQPKDYVILKDTINKYNYIIQMQNGSLVSFVKTASIKVTTSPTKTDYTDTEEFDPTGMVVIAVGEDGSEREIADYAYEKYVTTESNTHTIKYIDETGTEYITEVSIVTRTIEDALTDFNYTANSDGTYTITGWKGTHNGVASTEMIFPNSELVII